MESNDRKMCTERLESLVQNDGEQTVPPNQIATVESQGLN